MATPPLLEPHITPPPALGPPIIGTDTAGSAPGVTQPQVGAGPSLPPSFPLGQAGTWLPPPQVGMGANTPFPTQAVRGMRGATGDPTSTTPSTVAGFVQPQFGTGSATAPTAASLFPAFTAAGPFQPIIYNATQMPGKPYG